MKKIYALIIIATVIASAAKQSHAQKWEKIQPDILYAQDKDKGLNVRVGIGTDAPTAMLDVIGMAQALSMKAKTAQFDFMLALTANVDELSVSLDATIKGKLFTQNIDSKDIFANSVDAKNYFINGNPFPLIHWTINPDGSIQYTGQVLVKRLDASEGISIGNFKFKNGGSVLPPAPIKDTISSSYEIVLRSDAELLQLAANQVSVQQQLGVGKPPGAGVALDILGDVKSTGNISAGQTISSDKVIANNIQAYGIQTQGDIQANGNLRSLSLSGTGDRQMLVDPNGNLKAGGSSSLLCPEWNGCGNGSMNPDALIDPKFLGTTDNFPLAFRTNNTEQIRILPNGNVGIGTSTPKHQLHLHSIEAPAVEKFFPLDSSLNFDSLGNSISLPIQTNPDFRTLQLTNNITGDQSTNGIILGLSGTAALLELQETNQLLIKAGGGLSLFTTNGNGSFTAKGGLSFVAQNGAMLLRSKLVMRFTVNNQLVISIPSNGNVGIGTISPSAKLDVNGTGKFSNNVTIGTSSANANLNLNGDIEISGSRLHVDRTGNVGIGITTPSAKLHIVNPTSTGLIVTTQHAGDYGYGIISEVNRDFTKAIAVTNNAAGGAQSFVVYGDGRVGIGGADPDGDLTYKLVVCGTIRSKEWVVENFTGCDFVFEENYKRMNYQEKEKWFKEKKHLRGIAPAKETDISGMKAGETISGIIMNVEENSLDIIDLQKENETLKKEINELKKQMQTVINAQKK